MCSLFTMRGEFMRAAKILAGRGNFQTLFEVFVHPPPSEDREGDDEGEQKDREDFVASNAAGDGHGGIESHASAGSEGHG